VLELLHEVTMRKVFKFCNFFWRNWQIHNFDRTKKLVERRDEGLSRDEG